MHIRFLAFAEQQGCRVVATGKGYTKRIFFGNQNLGYVNPTVICRDACYGYRFRFGVPDDAAQEGEDVLFRLRYGDLPGLDWHDGTGTNKHRRFLCITEMDTAKNVLLRDIIELVQEATSAQ